MPGNFPRLATGFRPENIRLVHVTTVPESLHFLRGQAGFLTERGFDVQVISSPGETLDHFAAQEGVIAHAVKMPRRITPVRDLIAVAQLCRCLRRIRPHIVHAHTPKGGLLGMISAWLAGVPVRIYHIHGLPLMTASGLKHLLLRKSEQTACSLAQQVLCVSNSIRQVAVAQGLSAANKIKVLLRGSINGVDAEGTFNPQRRHPDVRERFGIPASALVLGYVGRIVHDKGMTELAAAWKPLRDEFPALHLLVVGPFEPQDSVTPEVSNLLTSDPRIHLTGSVCDLPPLYAVMDLVVLPTYREGFPVVPLEAAAMGLPVVATRIPGCVEAVQDGVTGTLVPARDAGALAGAVRHYLRDTQLRRKHGQAGRGWVLEEFRPEAMHEALYEEYLRLLRLAREPRALRDADRSGPDSGHREERRRS